MPLARRLDKCDFVDLFQSGQSAPHAVNGRLAQELHPLLLREAANLRPRLLLQNNFTDRIRQVEQLVNRRAAPVAGSTALNAARALAEIEIIKANPPQPTVPTEIPDQAIFEDETAKPASVPTETREG